MEKFVRVEKKKEDVPIGENEVRVTAVGRLYNYVNYAATLYNVQMLSASKRLRGVCRRRDKSPWCSKAWAEQSTRRCHWLKLSKDAFLGCIK